jgi:hypothetical protein
MSAPDYASRFDRAAALKHDLAKYVAWRSANLPDEAWTGPLSEDWLGAVRSDLLATRTREGRPESATEVWTRLGIPLLEEAPSPELERIESAMRVVSQAESALRADDRDEIAALRANLREAQHTIREACAALVRSTRAS